MAKSTSTEYRMYLAIWRKAWLERDRPDVLVVNASTYSMAINMRQGMYRAIRPYRNGLAFDADLSSAAEKFVVYLERGPDVSAPHQLQLRPRLTLTELEREMLALGLDAEDLLLGEERLANAELSKLLDSPTNSTRPANPFYSREDS